jgi:cytochrome oxidase Cu insertion factor (SCO1/SenC/PrrC family)
MTPRAKLLALVALFAAPIVASFVTYHFFRPTGGASYGELLLPPATVTAQAFTDPAGTRFAFEELRGKWVLVASDSGECAAACAAKLTLMRQVRLALGREAARVERVFVVDDLRRPAPSALDAYEGMRVALTPAGLKLPPGAVNDRAHVYLVDPNGNVMMRWPVAAEPKRMLADLKRLLKASQIG